MLFDRLREIKILQTECDSIGREWLNDNNFSFRLRSELM